MEVQFVKANGIRHAFVEEGQGPLVLLFHGFPDTPATWDHVRPALAKAGYRAVSPWLRGYAPTEIPSEDAHSGALGADVLALVEALGADRATLVGHDWGADAVYSAASLDSARIDKLVAVGIPHPATLPRRLNALWGARHFAYLKLPGAGRFMQTNHCAHVRTLYRRWSPTWDVPDSELEPIRKVFADSASVNAAVGYYRTLSLMGAHAVYRGRRIAVPTLVVGGQDDPALTIDDYRAAQRKFAGPYRVEGLPGGHFVHRESPTRFIELLLDFLGQPAG
jgi:pimeloyl-ACP methyl ester carboxylesterase